MKLKDSLCLVEGVKSTLPVYQVFCVRAGAVEDKVIREQLGATGWIEAGLCNAGRYIYGAGATGGHPAAVSGRGEVTLKLQSDGIIGSEQIAVGIERRTVRARNAVEISRGHRSRRITVEGRRLVKTKDCAGR